MNEFFGPSDWQIGVAVIGAIAFMQTSVVLSMTLGAARIFRRQGPAVRSAILRAGLVAIVICPIAWLSLRRLGMPGVTLFPPVEIAVKPPLHGLSAARQNNLPSIERRASRETLPKEKDAKIGSQILDEIPVALTPPRAVPVRNATPDVSWTSKTAHVLAVVWIAVSGLLLARLLIANLLIAFMRRRARPASLEIQRRCELNAKQLGMRAPGILVTREISGPCLVGWFWPVIVLPDDTEGVTQEILVHELAHLKRWDCAWQLLAQIAVAIVWFQPLMWVWAREMESSAEEACDDMVLARGGDRANYVRRLAELAEMAQPRWVSANAGVGVVEMKSSVGRRIVRILNAGNSIPARLGWRGRSCIAFGAALVVIGLGLIRPTARSAARADEPKLVAIAANRYHGRVLDPDGKPVKGAQVFVVDSNGGMPRIVDSTRTDAVGNFDVTYEAGRGEDRTEIQAYAAGKGVGSSSGPQPSDEIHLMPTTRAALTVRGPDGQPVPNLRIFPTFIRSNTRNLMDNDIELGRVMFLRLVPALSQSMAGSTDAQGRVTLNDLPQQMQFEVGFDDARFARLDYSKRNKLRLDEAAGAAITVQLDPGATMAGVVRYGATGQPAAGIAITAETTDRSPSSNWGEATSDGKGQFVIKSLGTGEYNVSLETDKELQKDWTAAAHERAEIKGGQNLSNIDFSLIKGGLITGKVTKADTGEPITRAEVGVYGPAHPRSTGMVQAATTGADGTYTLRVPPGAQHIYVMGMPLDAYRQDHQDFQDVNVDDGQTVTADFKVKRRGGDVVNGVVIGLNGKAAAGINVSAQNGKQPFGDSEATTDAQGRFHFDAIAPKTAITVNDGDLGLAKPVHVEKGKGEITLQLIKRTKLTLRGLITDKQDVPISGARIQLYRWFGSYGLGVGDPLVSGADGRYEIKDLYTDNNYDIAAEADGFGEAQTKIVWKEKMSELPTLELARADATTGGVVVDPDGKPVSGVTVTLGNRMFPKEAITDAEGRFSFHVAEGTRGLVSIRLKNEGVLGPHANAPAGKHDLKLVLPKGE